MRTRAIIALFRGIGLSGLRIVPAFLGGAVLAVALSAGAARHIGQNTMGLNTPGENTPDKTTWGESFSTADVADGGKATLQDMQRRWQAFTAAPRNLHQQRTAGDGQASAVPGTGGRNEANGDALFERQAVEAVRIAESKAVLLPGGGALTAPATSDITTSSLKSPPVNTPAAQTCGEPAFSVAPLPGGRLTLTATSPCHARQPWIVRYGASEFKRQLDAKGQGTLLLDLFQGAYEPLHVRFPDGVDRPVAMPRGDLGGLTKVALIWDGDFSLDLHAFEFAAAVDAPGHVWQGAAAIRDANDPGTIRGRGFITRMDQEAPGTKVPGTKVQIYTFVHNSAQAGGTIGLAVDYASRGGMANAPYCGDSSMAQPAYQVVITDQAGRVTRENQMFAAARCGEVLPPHVRFQTGLVPDLRLRR